MRAISDPGQGAQEGFFRGRSRPGQDGRPPRRLPARRSGSFFPTSTNLSQRAPDPIQLLIRRVRRNRRVVGLRDPQLIPAGSAHHRILAHPTSKSSSSPGRPSWTPWPLRGPPGQGVQPDGLLLHGDDTGAGDHRRPDARCPLRAGGFALLPWRLPRPESRSRGPCARGAGWLRPRPCPEGRMAAYSV
jgi:hypothetical protein